MRKFVLKDGATVVPPNGVLVWPGVPLLQHLHNVLPAWSMSARPPREVFAEWVFNSDIQCSKGTVDNSVCTEVTSNETTCKTHATDIQPLNATNSTCYPGIDQAVAVNPWLGGNFNPWEGCDTASSTQIRDRDPVNEHIDASCNPGVCVPPNDNTDSYWTRMPNRIDCQAKDGKSVSQANVLPSSESNLCSKTLEVPPNCDWEQGQAMQGMKGSPVVDLYSTAPPEPMTKWLGKVGQGLFTHGGNPMYYTTKGSETQILEDRKSVV